MATQEEMSRYFWSASTNCLPVLVTCVQKYWTFRNNLVFNPGGAEPIDFVKHGSAKARRFRVLLFYDN